MRSMPKACCSTSTTLSRTWDTLEAVDAIIFGCPTYMGSVSAKFKEFIEAPSHKVFTKGEKWANKIATDFTNAASRSARSIVTLAANFHFCGPALD